MSVVKSRGGPLPLGELESTPGDGQIPEAPSGGGGGGGSSSELLVSPLSSSSSTCDPGDPASSSSSEFESSPNELEVFRYPASPVVHDGRLAPEASSIACAPASPPASAACGPAPSRAFAPFARAFAASPDPLAPPPGSTVVRPLPCRPLFRRWLRWVHLPWSRAIKPKSESRTSQPTGSAKSKFSGLTSRCMTPLACRCWRAASTPRMTTAASNSVKAPRDTIRSKSSPPCARSITSRRSCGVSYTSSSGMMLGWRSCANTRISSRSLRSSLGFPTCCALGIIFTAMSRPVRLHLAARTTLKPPRPMMGPTA
mmetsp:Transcript_12994/g.30669  ORF Transcript_12994/g.30669 Transcript_12994/m.30669 type:complete len:313 (+) Transcript_12994:505-1443(+)